MNRDCAARLAVAQISVPESLSAQDEVSKSWCRKSAWYSLTILRFTLPSVLCRVRLLQDSICRPCALDNCRLCTFHSLETVIQCLPLDTSDTSPWIMTICSVTLELYSTWQHEYPFVDLQTCPQKIFFVQQQNSSFCITLKMGKTRRSDFFRCRDSNSECNYMRDPTDRKIVIDQWCLSNTFVHLASCSTVTFAFDWNQNVVHAMY